MISQVGVRNRHVRCPEIYLGERVGVAATFIAAQNLGV